MYHDVPGMWKEWMQAGLDDDAWQWDWTTQGCLKDPKKTIRAKVVCKADGVWAADGASKAVELLSAEMGMPIRVRSAVPNGAAIRKGEEVIHWEGPAQAVLALERPYLNLAQYACGVATQTRALVDALDKAWPADSKLPRPRVTATRKTLPGYRDIAVSGVIAGGGHSHRVSLSGGVLIKENHIAAAGGIAQAVAGVRALAPHGLLIEVEVRDLAELVQAIESQADAVLLDNFPPDRVRSSIELLGKRAPAIKVEVSGGIDSSNIASYAIAGVHVISSGSLTHSVRALDLSMLVGQ